MAAQLILIKQIDLTGSNGYHKCDYITLYNPDDRIDRLMMERHYSKCEIVWSVKKLKRPTKIMPNGHRAAFYEVDGVVYARYVDGSCGPYIEGAA